MSQLTPLKLRLNLDVLEQKTFHSDYNDVFFMLLSGPYFKTFIKKEIADASRSTETILALTCECKAKVDEPVDKAPAEVG